MILMTSGSMITTTRPMYVSTDYIFVKCALAIDVQNAAVFYYETTMKHCYSTRGRSKWVC